MCGIIGIISRENRNDLGALLAFGLYQQQNRGDFSAGIATIKKLPYSRQEYRQLREIAVEHDIEQFMPLRIRKGHGKVNEVFKEHDLEELTGFMGIGQVRYPTAGYTESPEYQALSTEEKNAMIQSSIQPMYVSRNILAMVHNGDIHNYTEVMEHFKERGLKQSGNNDLETLLKVFAEEFFGTSENIKDVERIEKTIKAIYNRVKGTYSSLALINNVGVVAFRDPEGRRPLLYGVTKDETGKITNYAFASETVALEKMLFKGTLDTKLETGRPAYDQVNPGEMMFITKDFKVYRRQIATPDPKPCPFEGSYFARAPSFINNIRVKNIRERIIGAMWERFKQDPIYTELMKKSSDTIIVPVPRTAITSAEYLSNISNLSFIEAIEKNPYSPRIFQQPTQAHRVKQTSADHFIYEERVKNKNILLIDDSIVRGTTLKQIVKYLKDVGTKQVHVFITFPPITGPCMHAIDFHTSEELIAHNKELSKVKTEIGLHNNETLMFATPEEIRLANNYKTMCDECYKT